ncbi:hypothetical protein ANOBCDAF_00417 [Pleomorphomonas sp. T1.2MG-36]|uniref:hypothetical protein n=1 Tax=Pleomorphomonas sp. T1.2MG-36 TaxID=3041167 RepID=UPI002477825E|nr:hypothetical protein [Pleomorphomonas sp. T1.2MG-36]CAI9400112.1 hypothetical protein ANOBCDAF_00417 [Pleomorphomonas sp. T1.2MG-36]
MTKINLDISDLMSSAHNEGYALKVVFADAAEVSFYLAARYMTEDSGAATDAVEEFRIQTDKTGDAIINGALDPNADYGEFFTEAFTADFRELAGRNPSGEDWNLFDSEIRDWVRHYADAEAKEEVRHD